MARAFLYIGLLGGVHCLQNSSTTNMMVWVWIKVFLSQEKYAETYYDPDRWCRLPTSLGMEISRGSVTRQPINSGETIHHCHKYFLCAPMCLHVQCNASSLWHSYICRAKKSQGTVWNSFVRVPCEPCCCWPEGWQLTAKWTMNGNCFSPNTECACSMQACHHR